jgi:putative transcriptional regulator
MSKRMKEALGDILRGTVDAGVKVPFTARELKKYGVTVKKVEVAPEGIRKVRRETRLSQAVFAKVLNVSLSSVRQWEQGTRTPTGATKVLLDLLSRQPRLIEQLL